MKAERFFLPVWFIAYSSLLLGCQREAVSIPVDVTRVVVQVVETEGQVIEVTRASSELVTLDWPAAYRQSQRLIIKNGDMTLTVEEPERALEAAVQRTIAAEGYVLSQRVWHGSDGYQYGQLGVAVPADQFENAMRAFRTLGAVSDESASGQDVTEEYVDLDSRLTNLQATQLRLRTFLGRADNVTETLAVEQELRKIEQELAVLQGRMNYLQDRAAFSTINLVLNPRMATAGPERWQPGETAGLAAAQLQGSVQDTADFGIYYGITCGPWLFLLGLVALVAIRLWRWGQRNWARPPLEQPAEAGD